MLLDLEYFQKNHINAVRTSHYPNQIPFYYMCDEMGIYMMAETNLESHGSWQKMGAIEPSYNVPGSLPQWKEAKLKNRHATPGFYVSLPRNHLHTFEKYRKSSWKP